MTAKNTAIIEYLNAICRMLSGKQKEYYLWVLKNGKFFSQRDLQKEKELISLKYCNAVRECYYNSQMAVLNSGNGLGYYEGWYVTENIPIPLEHGFLVFNNKVVDLTVGDRGRVLEYFGVHIPTEFVRQQILETEISDAMLGFYWYDKEEKKWAGI